MCQKFHLQHHNNNDSRGLKSGVKSMMVEFSTKIIPDEWLGHFDMLRDSRRNYVYARNIQLAFNFKSSADQNQNENEKEDSEEYWIDIGCGSGLLGCLVAKYLKMKVVSFECVPKLAKIARQTIIQNNLQDYVMVWLVHTNDLDSQFMERTFGKKASYVVSELLDTTLLGEGLYEGLRHAHSYLLTPQPTTIPKRISSIPHSARVFIQAWSGECIANRRNMNDDSLSRLGLSSSIQINNCLPSSASTIQWSYFSLHGAFPITEPVQIFDFDFTSLRHSHSQATVTLSPLLNLPHFPVAINALLMYWECCCCCCCSDCVQESSSSVSSPGNCFDGDKMFHSRGNGEGFITDHWRQSVFFLNSNEFYFNSTQTPSFSSSSSSLPSPSSESLQLQCYHNEDDIWIKNVEIVSRDNSLSTKSQAVVTSHQTNENHPVCTCGFHSAFSAFQINELNSNQTCDWILEIVHQVDLFLNEITHSLNRSCGIFIIVTDHVICSLVIAKHLHLKYIASTTRDSTIPPVKFFIISTSKSVINASTLFFESNGLLESLQGLVSFIEMNSIEKDDCEGEDESDDNTKASVNWVDELVNNILQFKQTMKDLHDIDELIMSPLHGIPYLSDLHDEGILHHIWTISDLYNLIIQEFHRQSILPLNYFPRFLDEYIIRIYCGLFTSPSLWHQYTGRIEMVEGIDMSSINILMREIPKQYSQMKSIRLSQWNAENLHAVSCVGIFEISQLRNIEENKIVWEGMSSLSITNNGSFHGVALFPILQHLNGECLYTCHPHDCPDSLQYFRCFSQETLFNTATTANPTQLNISIKITTKNYNNATAAVGQSDEDEDDYNILIALN